jgi:8-oxo-dGTP pyrophosphatase MutT (NUDIX family)
MPDQPEPIPAATLVLMRACAARPPEILLIERAGNMAFAAGALVFPGGRIDPADGEAATLFPDFADAPARIAAIRETIEETGIAAATAPAAGPDDAAALRAALCAGIPFADALAARGLALDLGALTPFARWCPNFRETRRFDTLFFLAQAPADVHAATADSNEAVRTFWMTAAGVLEEVDAGRAHVIFPTRRNLERLACFSTFEEAVADAERHPVRRITPWIEEREGRPHVCIPHDAGYPVTSEPLETARRR